MFTITMLRYIIHVWYRHGTTMFAQSQHSVDCIVHPAYISATILSCYSYVYGSTIATFYHCSYNRSIWSAAIVNCLSSVHFRHFRHYYICRGGSKSKNFYTVLILNIFWVLIPTIITVLTHFQYLASTMGGLKVHISREIAIFRQKCLKTTINLYFFAIRTLLVYQIMGNDEFAHPNT